jgi:hypothetical protein
MDTALPTTGIIAVTMADTGGHPTGITAHTTDRLSVDFRSTHHGDAVSNAEGVRRIEEENSHEGTHSITADTWNCFRRRRLNN